MSSLSLSVVLPSDAEGNSLQFDDAVIQADGLYQANTHPCVKMVILFLPLIGRNVGLGHSGLACIFRLPPARPSSFPRGGHLSIRPTRIPTHRHDFHDPTLGRPKEGLPGGFNMACSFRVVGIIRWTAPLACAHQYAARVRCACPVSWTATGQNGRYRFGTRWDPCLRTVGSVAAICL